MTPSVIYVRITGSIRSRDRKKLGRSGLCRHHVVAISSIERSASSLGEDRPLGTSPLATEMESQWRLDCAAGFFEEMGFAEARAPLAYFTILVPWDLVYFAILVPWR
jgi:hypothetical protein